MSQYQNSVSFQAPSELVAEQGGIERQRKLADALLLKSQQPGPQGQMIGNVYVPPSWTQSLSHALSGPLGIYRAEKADERAKDVAAKQRKVYADELTKFSELANGTPAQPEVQGNNPSAYTPPQAGQPGDKRAALAMALGSQNPVLQQYGMSQMMPKEAKWEKAELPNPDGSKRVGYVNINSPDPLSTFQAGGTAPVKLEGVNTGGDTTFVNPYAPKAEGAPSVAATGNPYKDLLVTGAGGQPTVNAPMLDAKKQIAAAGKSNNNTTVINQGPREFEKELGQLDAKALDRYRTNAETAQSTIGTVQALRAAEAKGAYSGGGANAKLAVANLINGITGAEVKGLVGSQVYNAEASKLVLDRVKALGANPSNADRDFIEKTVPQLATSATARAQMADYMEKKAAQSIDLYKRADTHARKNHGLGGFDQFENPSSVPKNVIDEADAIIRGSK